MVQVNGSQGHHPGNCHRVQVTNACAQLAEQLSFSHSNIIMSIVFSLYRKLPDLQKAIIENESDIAGATDAWLNAEISDAEINIYQAIIFFHYTILVTESVVETFALFTKD